VVLSAVADDSAVKIASRRIGPALVFERLWEETGCRTVIEEFCGARKHGFALERAVFLTMLHRLFVSGSDRAAAAYILGLRQAVDADHIAAIDNVVRKLMHKNKRPLSVGLFFSLGHSTVVVLVFSLGHSTVVVLATAAIAFSAASLQARFETLRDTGGVIGTAVSATFLLMIALINVMILRKVWSSFQHVRRGGYIEPDHLNMLLVGEGLLARLFRPLFRVVSKSWHMYPLGFLFGLGFDTATEIGLLGISASQASQNMSPLLILVFPALFTAGMTLIDTTDGVFMIGAYGWAFVNPLRKLWYNLTITAVSVAVAALIGGSREAELASNSGTQSCFIAIRSILHGPLPANTM
jgi:nickel/cobalt transporter (NiCoT) family protein